MIVVSGSGQWAYGWLGLRLCALFVLLFRCIICSLYLALFALHVYLFLFVLRFICITCLFIYLFFVLGVRFIMFGGIC